MITTVYRNEYRIAIDLIGRMRPGRARQKATKKRNASAIVGVRNVLSRNANECRVSRRFSVLAEMNVARDTFRKQRFVTLVETPLTIFL